MGSRGKTPRFLKEARNRGSCMTFRIFQNWQPNSVKDRQTDRPTDHGGVDNALCKLEKRTPLSGYSSGDVCLRGEEGAHPSPCASHAPRAAPGRVGLCRDRTAQAAQAAARLCPGPRPQSLDDGRGRWREKSQHQLQAEPCYGAGMAKEVPASSPASSTWRTLEQ